MPTSKDITLNVAHNKLLHVKALVAETLQTSIMGTPSRTVLSIVQLRGYQSSSVRLEWVTINTIYTLYSARMNPENVHKLMGFYMEVLILGII